MINDQWERQPGETNKAFAAFCIYRDLGPGRSAQAAVSANGTTPGKQRSTLRWWEKWRSQHKWEDRAGAWDDHVDKARREAILKSEGGEAMRKHVERARLIAEKLIAVGIDMVDLAHRSILAYKSLPPESVQPNESAALVRAGIQALQMGLDAEAHALGVDHV